MGVVREQHHHSYPTLGTIYVLLVSGGETQRYLRFAKVMHVSINRWIDYECKARIALCILSSSSL